MPQGCCGRRRRKARQHRRHRGASRMRTRYVDIDDRMEDLADRLRGDPELAQDFLSKYELSWLYHENALEGVVYTGQELATALVPAPVTDVTFVSALQEIRNHKTALDL